MVALRLSGVFQTIQADAPVSRKERRPFDRFYNFFQAVWPEVRELTPILVVLVRDPRGKFKDKYLFTTDLNADLGWIMAAFSARQSSKRQLTPSRPQRPTCVNYSTT